MKGKKLNTSAISWYTKPLYTLDVGGIKYPVSHVIDRGETIGIAAQLNADDPNAKTRIFTFPFRGDPDAALLRKHLRERTVVNGK
ncbi:MAG: hypothetical protein FWC51_04540 [Proteobacteria bacterium]|nr:hypothetical protein [Pseudomonadota bacterium]